MAEKKDKKEFKDDGVVYIGNKNFINYLNAANMQLQRNEVIILKARGKNINRAVDVSEVIKKQYGTKTEEIKISSETFKTDEGREVRVSTIEIVVKK